MHANKSIKITFWNAQSITSAITQKQLELFAFREKIDIILLAETFLKKQHTLLLKNFTIYRNDRLYQAHGGVAIAVNKNINHKFISPFPTKHMENIAIEVTINNTPTLVVAAYSPKYHKDFENDIQLMSSSTTQSLIFGDFNAKHYSWNCNKTNKAGNILYKLQQNNSFMVFHTAEHTHHPHSGHSPSTIDLVLANVNFHFELTALSGYLSSDHNPIVCDIHDNIQISHNKIFDYKKANWNNFSKIISNKLRIFPVPQSPPEIDMAIDNFTKTILDAQAQSIPTKIIKNRPTISSNTEQLIKQKNTIKRRWQRCHVDPDKTLLKAELNKLQKIINQNITRDSKEYWDKSLQTITKGHKKLWDISKKLKGKTDSAVNKMKIPHKPIYDDADKANCLATIFRESHTITHAYSSSNDQIVQSTINAFKTFSVSSSPNAVLEDEIINIIKSLKPFKSPGPDKIQNILLKHLPNIAISWFTAMLNKCITLSYWPASFKTAKVIPILKAGKTATEPKSYRPISLLNTMGKILEKIIYKRLVSIVEEKNLLPNYQFGFRRGHSTIHQAARIKQHIQENKRQNKSTGMILLDIEKAFDSIWHDGLIYKLIKMKLPSYLIHMINAFIRNRKFAVHVNRSTSDLIDIPAGLAQGTCISPILYAIFVADMPVADQTEAAMYADDTSVYTSAKQSKTIINRLNEAFSVMQQFFDMWKIKINTTKTQAIIFPFDNKRKRIPINQLKSGAHTIPLEKSVKYLGITFDSKLNFGEHITNTIDKANKCFRALYSILAPNSQLSIQNKSLIYTSIIRPILSYGSPIWISAANVHLKKFTTIQNKVLKTIHNLHRRTPTIFIEKITGISHFHKYILSLSVNFAQNCHNSDFSLIREIDLL